MYKIFCYLTDTFWKTKGLSTAVKKIFNILDVNFCYMKLWEKTDVKEENILLCKILDIYSNKVFDFWFDEEKNFENKYFYNQLNNTHLYDGFRLQEVYCNQIKPKFKECHIVFTERIIATLDDADGRYHSRVVILGYPCIISIKGLTKALALYKDYYNIKNVIPVIGERIKEDIYSIVDKNLFKFLLKYVVQCILYIFFDEEFCNCSFCLHFNHHWFLEVYEQINNINEKDKFSKLFCEHHKNLFSKIKRNGIFN